MPSLYELSSDLERVIDGGMIVDMDTGEVLFDEENLDQLKATVAEKVLACKMFADGQRSKAQSLKDSHACAYERNVIVPLSGSMESMMARLSTW